MQQTQHIAKPVVSELDVTHCRPPPSPPLVPPPPGVALTVSGVAYDGYLANCMVVPSDVTENGRHAPLPWCCVLCSQLSKKAVHVGASLLSAW